MRQRPPCGREHREHVVPIYDLRRYAVRRSLIRHIGARHLRGKRGGVRVLVVVADEDHGQLLHGREIYAFVPIAAAGGAVAEVGKADALPSLVSHGQRRTRGHRHRGRQRADDRYQPQFQIAHVHVAFAPARRPVRPAHVLREDLPRRYAANQHDRHVAMAGKQHVLGLRQQRRSHRDGLLPAPHVHAAYDLALPVQLALDAVFNLTHLQHVIQALARQIGFFARARIRVRSNGLCYAHEDPLARISRYPRSITPFACDSLRPACPQMPASPVRFLTECRRQPPLRGTTRRYPGKKEGFLNGSHGYPRPQLERAEWYSLDGEWKFALDPEGVWKLPDDAVWNARIQVPFSPETRASGIGDTGFYRAVWYRRNFEPPRLNPGDRLMLHFCAVDYSAKVWVNGHLAADHEGGFTPFCADVTEYLAPSGPQTVVVCADDDPGDLSKPRGKQDWQLHPHSIWYPRTTGIWQPVWMERLPATYVGQVRWIPNVERWELGFEAWIVGESRSGLRLNVTLYVGETLLADDSYGVVANEVHRRIALSDPGIDDYRNELLWSPETPTLIYAEIKLIDENGALVDTARIYTALRSIGAQGDKFVLNGRPYPLRLILDQGYWPDTGLTAPDDEAFRRDVELAKAMGFNGVRKHQKIESPRYLYWADTQGLLVWEEMPSAYRFTRASIERLCREWTEAVKRDVSHPCIIAWVPFNESWGVPDLPNNSNSPP